MKKILTLIAMFPLALAALAQEGGRIAGSIIDGNQKTVESATIALMKAADSSTVKFSVADKDGKFQFEAIAVGQYFVSVSAVGHEKGFTKAFQVKDGEKVSLPVLNLVPVAKEMNTVVVTARKPLIEQKIDRTVVNVEASITNVGTTALEVLEKSPGISVDKDGNISLKGKEGVLVLVDGRPTQLSGADLANLLRNMNSSQLDQIEIMTNPPARFDAAGNAGVINIKTKKSKQSGYSGSVTLGYSQGTYPKFNEGVNFNYRQGKVNLFTNLSHNYRQSWNRLDIQRNLLEDGTKDIKNYFDQSSRMYYKGNNWSAKVGADYSPGKNTTIGVVLNGFSSPSDFGNRNLTLISDNASVLESQTKALVDYNNNWKNYSANLNFRQVLDTTGREITADADYITYNSSVGQTLQNFYFDADGLPSQVSDTLLGALPQDINIYSGRIDYTHPLAKGAKFEAGVKSSIVRTDNNAVYDSIQNGQPVRDLGRSNHFVYEENINAAYVNLSGSVTKKLNAQLGLRLENTVAKGDQRTTGEDFDRRYTQLFPTAYLQYQASEKNNFGLNYGRRIRRPNYQSLNPFIQFLDRYTYQQGNPDLKPQLSDNIELSHTYNRFLTTTLNLTTTKDIIQQVIEQKGEEAYARQANIARQRQVGLAVSANLPINKWWTSSIYVNGYVNEFEGLVNNEPISFSSTTLRLNGSQQFKISKTFSAELSGFYTTGGVEGVVNIQPMGMLNVGFSQQVFNNKGSIRLTVRDIFNTGYFSAISKYGNVDAQFQERHENRVVNLGFTYRFSKGKAGNGPKRRTGSASDEQSRVGGAQ